MALPLRHPLGLPAGSVRGIMTLLIVGITCLLLWVPPRDGTGASIIPDYMLYLVMMTVMTFFAAHGSSIARRADAEPSPLYLPGGLLRLTIFGALVATIVYRIMNEPETLQSQLTASLTHLKDNPWLPLVMLGAFFLGYVFRTLFGRDNTPYWFQDIQAWFALLATIGIVIAGFGLLVIAPHLRDYTLGEHRLAADLLAGMVAFYFGQRS